MLVYYTSFSLLLVYGASAFVQLSQNGGQANELVSSTTENVNVTTQAPVGCRTVRNLSGVCVIRAKCNYGPGDIDFTLYSPSWYKRTCKVGEACCPFKYLTVETQPSKVVDSFEFDEDD